MGRLVTQSDCLGAHFPGFHTSSYQLLIQSLLWAKVSGKWPNPNLTRTNQAELNTKPRQSQSSGTTATCWARILHIPAGLQGLCGLQ